METIPIDAVGVELEWFNPEQLSDEDKRRLSRLVTWSFDKPSGCYRVRRRVAHKIGRVVLGNYVFSVLPDMGAANFTTFFLHSIGVNVSRFAHNRASPVTAALGSDHIEYDLLIGTLMALSCEQLATGYLARGYERRDERTLSLKGSVNWAQSFNAPRLLGLPCTYQEITTNNLLNQVVLSGLIAAAKLDIPISVRQRLNRLEHLWASVCSQKHVRLTDIEVCERNLTRLTESYRTTLALCRMLLFGFGPDDLFGGGRGFLQCLEFDLSVIFERFVRRVLEDQLSGTGVYISFQDSTQNELISGSGSIYMKTRPDFLLCCEEGPLVVLDAKYKPRYVSLSQGEDFGSKNRLDASDMYQMLFYADRLKNTGVKRAYVLAPRLDTGSELPPESERVVYWKQGTAQGIEIRIYEVDLLAAIESIREDKPYPADGIRRLCNEALIQVDERRALTAAKAVASNG